MPAQIALSLVWILVGPQERKETVNDQSPKGLLMFNVCVGVVLMHALDWMLQTMKRRFTHIFSASVATTRCSAS